MTDLQAIADRVEIEALRGEFTDAAMMRDRARLASLFTPGGVLRMPNIHVELAGREEIRAGGERLQNQWDFFVQNTHPGTIQLDGDTATGRAYVQELARTCDGRQELNYAIYHDRYRRTPEGWKFTERVYEVRYLDTSPLAGSAPPLPGRPQTRRPGARLRQTDDGDQALVVNHEWGSPGNLVRSAVGPQVLAGGRPPGAWPDSPAAALAAAGKVPRRPAITKAAPGPGRAGQIPSAAPPSSEDAHRRADTAPARERRGNPDERGHQVEAGAGAGELAADRGTAQVMVNTASARTTASSTADPRCVIFPARLRAGPPDRPASGRR